jgi:hypothetical protein
MPHQLKSGFFGGAFPPVLEKELGERVQGFRVIGIRGASGLEGLECRVHLPGPTQGPPQEEEVFGAQLAHLQVGINRDRGLVAVLMSRRARCPERGPRIFRRPLHALAG